MTLLNNLNIQSWNEANHQDLLSMILQNCIAPNTGKGV